MSENLIYLLAIFGGASLGIAIITLVWLLSNIIGDKLKNAKRKRQIKHRFDKPPRAECYCVDCTQYEQYDTALDTEFGKCLYHSIVRSDNDFCSSARPVKNPRR